jgi:nicotinate-nucleotide pyrophosphorylase (carboxylating)
MECRDKREVLWALDAKAEIVLLDNVPIHRLARVCSLDSKRMRRRGTPAPALEVSGGVTLKAMPRLVRADVDRISIGRLTHSAPALDMSLDVEIL